MGAKTVVTCFQCVAMPICYGKTNGAEIDLNREQARAAAAECARWEKGLPTEVIKVYGRQKGMSRKKAQLLIGLGKGQWIEDKLVKLTIPEN